MWIEPHPACIPRRRWLQTLGGGLASLGAVATLQASSEQPIHDADFAPRAKRVIHLFMNGGPFQGDLFDPKPEINRCAGQRPDAYAATCGPNARPAA